MYSIATPLNVEVKRRYSQHPKFSKYGINRTMNNSSEIILRPTTVTDLEKLFVIQLNEEANHIAAFTSKDATDKAAYLQKFTGLLNDPTINNQTITVNNIIIGSIAKFEMRGHAEITYWIDKPFWNKGVATAALRKFLVIENTRPIFASAAFDNIGSQKVLEKAGFIKTGTARGFAHARQAEIEEFIYQLV